MKKIYMLIIAIIMLLTIPFIMADVIGLTNDSSYWLCINEECTETCQVILEDGLITGCGETLKENCNDKDGIYCDNNDLVTDDYYCETGFGNNDDCVVGHCLVDRRTETCSNGCEDKKCNLTQIEDCTIKPNKFVCWYSPVIRRTIEYSRELDYTICGREYGNATHCDFNHCLYKTASLQYCRNGCDTTIGKCK